MFVDFTNWPRDYIEGQHTDTNPIPDLGNEDSNEIVKHVEVIVVTFESPLKAVADTGGAPACSFGKFDKIFCWRPPSGSALPPTGNPGSAPAM